MKWVLRFFGCCDVFTFLIFISPKFQYLQQNLAYQYFSMAQKASALWEVLVLFLFLIAGVLLLFQKKSGLITSFILIPFRVTFLYFSFDFMSYLLYHIGFQNLVSTSQFQNRRFFILLGAEVLRYAYSFFAYYRLSTR